jgi:hypothetical protein
MRSVFIVLILSSLYFPVFSQQTPSSSAQEDCGDQAVMSVKGGWKKRADANMRYDKNQAHIDHCLDSISKIFQWAVSDLRGVEAAWYRSMSDPVVPGGPAAYNFNSMYLPWYCNKNLHKMMLSDETGTWVYVFVNSLAWLLSDQYDQLSISVDGAKIYMRPSRKSSWKGHDCYQPSGHGASENCILLTHGNRPPWKAVSQEQYLRAWRAYLEDLKKKSGGHVAAQNQQDQKEIEQIQNNNSLKPEQKKAVLDGIQKRQSLYAGNGDGGTGTGTGSGASGGKMDKYYDDKMRLVDDYLGHASQELLGQPAVIGPNEKSGFEGHFSSEEKGGRMLVTIDPDYFSKQAPGYTPQVMVLYWRWGNDAASQHFKKQFEDDFPVDRLSALLDIPVK